MPITKSLSDPACSCNASASGCTPPTGCPQAGVPAGFVGPYQFRYAWDDPYCSCKSSQPWTPAPTPTITPTPTKTPAPCVYTFNLTTASSHVLGDSWSFSVPPAGSQNWGTVWANNLFQAAYNACWRNASGGGYADASCMYYNLWNSGPVLNPTCGSTWGPSCSSGTIAFDSQGKRLSSMPTNATKCYSATYQWDWWYSPVALEWEKDTNIMEVSKSVRFAMNPHEEPQMAMWRGSPKAPLLVWDPTGSGTISSGADLIGTWSFGGREGETPWNDGYEVLQLLDKNGDEKLSGLELRSLRLWFDANSDAISDPGEVVDLDSKGVSVIFITPDERNDEVGLVRASKGFIRKDENGTFVGASVDWFAGTAKDSNTLMEKLSMSAPFEAGANASHQLSYIEKPPSHYNINADIAGVWEFNADSGRPPTEKDHGPQGYLAISELKDGTLEAASFGTLDFSDGSLPGVAQMLKIHLLQGKKEDKNRYSFLLETKETRVETTAVLDPETKTLKGESRGYVKAREGQTVELSYKWTARRLPPPLNNATNAEASSTQLE